MGQISMTIPDDLHDRARALKNIVSMSRLMRLGLSHAIAHFEGVDEQQWNSLGPIAPRQPNGQPPGQVPRRVSISPRPPESKPTHRAGTHANLDPQDATGLLLKPYVDSRGHEWYGLEAALDLVGLGRLTFEGVIDPEDDLDRDNMDRVVADAATLLQAFRILPGSAFGNPEAAAQLGAWLEGRRKAKP